jgi:hypothetical protein
MLSLETIGYYSDAEGSQQYLSLANCQLSLEYGHMDSLVPERNLSHPSLS